MTFFVFLLISLIVILILCAVIWKFVPVILSPLIGDAYARAVAACIILIIVLVWAGGGFGLYGAPWGFYRRAR